MRSFQMQIGRLASETDLLNFYVDFCYVKCIQCSKFSSLTGFCVLQQGGCMRVSSWLPAVSHAVAEDTYTALNYFVPPLLYITT